jgi:hypothetical protein
MPYAFRHTDPRIQIWHLFNSLWDFCARLWLCPKDITLFITLFRANYLFCQSTQIPRPAVDCTFRDGHQISNLLIYQAFTQDFNLVPTWCRLGANLVRTWSRLGPNMLKFCLASLSPTVSHIVVH